MSASIGSGFDVVVMKESDYLAREDDFIDLYQLCFGKCEYYEEDFSDREVVRMASKMWFNPYSVMVAVFEKETDRLCAYAVAYDLKHEPEIVDSIRSHVSMKEYMYVAEILTHPDFRRHGLASQILQKLIEKALLNYERLLMRTNINNLPSQNLFKKHGFEMINGLTQEVAHKRLGYDHEEADKRIFMEYHHRH